MTTKATKRRVLREGDPAPTFITLDQDGNQVSLKSQRGKWVVLYFYPKDDTPGCTLEARDFTRSLDVFKESEATVFGVSPDSCRSHQKFIQKHGLKVILLSDPEHTILEAFRVWKKKKLYGREYMGVERATFLINPSGRVAHVWKKVKVDHHADAVFEKLKELQSA